MGTSSDPRAQVTRTDIARGLDALGIRPGEIVYVHSSLSAFGHVHGGADTVIDALLDTVGAQGTVVMPTFTWQRNHARPTLVFNVAHDPSETGRITEVFRRRRGVVRNEHVCHSTAAFGPAADDVMGGSVHPFAFDASLYRCYELNSWYLLLGCGFSSATALHTAEEIVQVPYRHYRNFQGSVVIRPDGTHVPAESVEFLRNPGYANDFAKMDAVFERDGILRHARVGNALLTSARIRDVIDRAVQYLKQDIGYLLDEPSRARWRAAQEREA
ncbi:MAG TPA: AAC(3) family N-acetyltransferase [Candidatus Hydrogenedentes bacterium]|jgi:aminoglycoside 3-N-acetyltransferase|nr:AAC(3) family N-acetyltransferase [Candidatus Hydrogenedentota bacterium]HPK00126.1 AAC(3) family N-acetyltransferase [Candidatus Hydrogenedentota bacterium]